VLRGAQECAAGAGTPYLPRRQKNTRDRMLGKVLL